MATMKSKPVDVWLAIGGVVVGILIFLLPKTPAVTMSLLVVAGLLLLHPVWNFWWIEESTQRRIVAMTALIAALGCMGAFVWPMPPGTNTSMLYVLALTLKVQLARINGRWLDRIIGALGMSLLFTSAVALRKAWSWIKKRRHGISHTPAKGLLEYKAEAETAIAALPKLLTKLTRIMGDVGPRITKHTQTLLRARTTEGQIKVARATSRSLDKFSARFERVGADYETIGKSLSEGLDGWTTWLGENATIETHPDLQEFLANMRTFADTIQASNGHTQDYIDAMIGNKGVSSELDTAIDRHVISVRLILKVNSAIRNSCTEALTRFEALPGV